MTYDFNKLLAGSAPYKFAVTMRAYTPQQVEIKVLSGLLSMKLDHYFGANSLTTAEIDEDEVIKQDGAMDTIRHAMLTATENIGKGLMDRWSAATLTDYNVKEPKFSDFLRPIFKRALISGKPDYVETMLDIEKAEIPVPEDYLVLLPQDEELRDLVIRNLVPFKRTQREALKAGWNGDTTVIAIHQHQRLPSIILSH